MKATISSHGFPIGSQEFQIATQVLEKLNAIVVVLDEQGQITMLNQAASSYIGYSPDEVMGRGWFEMIMPRERYPMGWGEFCRIAGGAVQGSFECSILTKIGEERTAIWHPNVLSSAGGFAGVLLLATDITSEKCAIAYAHDAEALLHHFIRHAPVAIAMFDREMRYLEASRKWLVDHEIEEKNIKGCLHHELFPQIEDAWKDMLRRCLGGEIVNSREEHFRKADGSLCWLRIDVRPWYDSGTNIGGIVVFCEDITSRRDSAMSVDAQMEELRRWHQATLGREVRILELKREVNRLLRAEGKPVRYASASDCEDGRLDDNSRISPPSELSPPENSAGAKSGVPS